MEKEEKTKEKKEEDKEEEIFGLGKIPDTYLGDVMWTTGNKEVMRQLVDESEAELEARKIRITTKSGEDAWCRAQAMKSAWTDENVWYRTRDMNSVSTDDK